MSWGGFNRQGPPSSSYPGYQHNHDGINQSDADTQPSEIEFRATVPRQVTQETYSNHHLAPQQRSHPEPLYSQSPATKQTSPPPWRLLSLGGLKTGSLNSTNMDDRRWRRYQRSCRVVDSQQDHDRGSRPDERSWSHCAR
jgi:hypothetical protein